MALQKETKDAIMQQYRLHESDSGSVEVQIALLTHEINVLNQHCLKHPKDFSTQRGLLRMVSRRKSFLAYLKRKNMRHYKNIIEKLSLRK